jgi:hypothetical protein
MKFLYLAHVPFVLLFLIFVAGFTWANRGRGK